MIEGCLCLPTVRELQVGLTEFLLSLLGTNSNINSLSLSGYPQIPDSSDHAFPQLKSLSVSRLYSPVQSFSAWAKRLVGSLQSLKYDCISEVFILELPGTCSDTLENLDIDFKTSHDLPYFPCQCFSSGLTLRPILFQIWKYYLCGRGKYQDTMTRHR